MRKRIKEVVGYCIALTGTAGLALAAVLAARAYEEAIDACLILGLLLVARAIVNLRKQLPPGDARDRTIKAARMSMVGGVSLVVVGVYLLVIGVQGANQLSLELLWVSVILLAITALLGWFRYGSKKKDSKS